MKSANVSDIQIVPDAFARAGAVLKQLNAGGSPDLTPCDVIAQTLKDIRKKVDFENPDEQALDPTLDRIRSAAATTVNPRFADNKAMFLNFLNEALGLVKKPVAALSERREKVGDFLIQVASAA